MGRTVKVKFDSREPELKELLEKVMPDVEVFFGDTLFTALNITAQKCRARNNPESKDLSAKFDEMLITNGDYIFSNIDSKPIDKKESVSDYAELTGENYYACISISSKKKSKEEITRELLEKIITQRQKQVVLVTAIAVVINVGLNLILIPKYSYIGLSVTTVTTEFLGFLLLFFYTKQNISKFIKLKE